jgi:hypothetical protein
MLPPDFEHSVGVADAPVSGTSVTVCFCCPPFGVHVRAIGPLVSTRFVAKENSQVARGFRE